LRDDDLSEAKLVELEKKIEVLMRGLNLLLLEEDDTFREQEVKDLKARLNDYLKGHRSEFVKLDEKQG
jgi:hypothetical protein